MTDDQGWRIEIKKYPKLVEEGSHRSQTQVGHSDYYYPRRFDGKNKRDIIHKKKLERLLSMLLTVL